MGSGGTQLPTFLNPLSLVAQALQEGLLMTVLLGGLWALLHI